MPFQAIVVSHHRALRDIARQMRDENRVAAFAKAAARRPATAQERRRAARQAPRQQQHAEMRRLLSAGASVIAVSRALGLDRKTVRRWARRDGPPLWTKPKRSTLLDPWRALLERRWQEGCRNAAELARELERRGAGVSPRVVRDWATRRRREGADHLDADPCRPTQAWRPPSSRRTTWLLQADPDTLASDDRPFIDALRHEVPELAIAADLVSRLTQILRRRSSEPLDDWVQATVTTPLGSFASMLRRDLDAVQAAIDTPWSTSPVEGQISRLKMLKRTMYGRAGFDLLRQRVLAPT
jgi:transposase